MQLAATGSKVGFLDLDSQGSHLSQVLPTDRDMRPEATDSGIEYVFTPDEDGDRPVYAKRPHFLSKLPGKGSLPLKKLVARLVVNSGIIDHHPEAREKTENVTKNLLLLLCSAYVSDRDVLNRYIFSTTGQVELRSFLSAIVNEFAEEGVDYVLIDNAPGFGFLSGTGMAWALDWASSNTDRLHLWFVSSPNWWEQGLIFYETRAYPEYLSRARPILVINRAQNNWLGRSEFPVGECRPLDGRLAGEIGKDLFSLPIWIAGAPNLAEQDVIARFIPPTYRVAVLGDDEEVCNSMLRSSEERTADRGGAAANERSSSRTQLFSHLADKFLRGFLLPALGVTETDPVLKRNLSTTFHEQVWRALVWPLIKTSESGSPGSRSAQVVSTG